MAYPVYRRWVVIGWASSKRWTSSGIFIPKIARCAMRLLGVGIDSHVGVGASIMLLPW
jgi:hypothetical protein